MTPWLFDLEVAERELSQFAAMLDRGERERAAAFHRPIDRARFVARRAQLRLLLGRCLEPPPEAVRLGATTHGKPYLVDRADLHFNVSSAGSLGLCVISRAGPVGCDIALRDDRLADMRVAEHIFSVTEHAALRALPPERRAEAFFNLWTRKEAYVKALGLGLSHPLDTFEVSLVDEAAPALVHAEPGWALRTLAVTDGYHAAVAHRLDKASDPAAPGEDQGWAKPLFFAPDGRSTGYHRAGLSLPT